MMIASSAEGRDGTSVRGATGGRVRIAAISPVVVSSTNGSRPVAIRYSTTPSEYRSERASMRSPRSASGGMYGGVPTRMAPVNCEEVTVTPAAGGGFTVRARPKSMTFACPSVASMMFAAERSR